MSNHQAIEESNVLNVVVFVILREGKPIVSTIALSRSCLLGLILLSSFLIVGLVLIEVGFSFCKVRKLSHSEEGRYIEYLGHKQGELFFYGIKLFLDVSLHVF